MIIVSANNLTKTYGIDIIFNNLSFNINENDRIGLVGVNGAGKTTLLNILSERIPYDTGEFFISNSTTIGYLQQTSQFESNNTVYDEMLSIFEEVIGLEKEITELEHQIASLSEQGKNIDKALNTYAKLTEIFKDKNGFGYKSEIKGILNSLNFPAEYFEKKISTLSGGEKTRLSLAALLLKKPDLLLLDEPTNHLDMDTLRWLEQYLKAYSGTVVLISHDRYFLDETTNRIFELENKTLTVYEGNYSQYIVKKREREKAELRKYEKQQKEIEKQEEIIRRFKQHGTEKLAKRAKSRENRLEGMEIMNKPVVLNEKIKINFKSGLQSGKDVLLAEGISKDFNGNTLFNNVNFDIKRGEKICLIGPNGIGKTTLLKIVLSTVPADTGTIKVGHNVIFGYYDQEQELLNQDNPILEEMHSAYRLYSETELRSLLGCFLFQNDDVFKQVRSLSGGEKARFSLLKIMLSGSNFLIMDEPTNHLDITSKEVFEDAILDFPGTLLMVSHDRYFLNKIPDRILELNKDGVSEYLGNYDYYIEKKRQLEEDKQAEQVVEITKTKLKEDRKKEKEIQQQNRAKKKELAALEAKIMEYEQKIQEFQHEMCKEEVYSNPDKSKYFHSESQRLKKELEETYQQWETMLEEIE